MAITAGGRGRVKPSTYAGKLSLRPDHGHGQEQQILQVGHGRHGVDQEANEGWKGHVRDAVGRPWTVMIHLGDASASRGEIFLQIEHQPTIDPGVGNDATYRLHCLQ